MAYTINRLAELAGVSVRTLHYYDEIGLLKPSRIRSNGYREYAEAELLRLQQIMFFRELDFPLAEIKRVMASQRFDMRAALADQRRLIELKKKRLTGLIATIDKTIKKLNDEDTMNDEELYDAFSDEEQKQYAAEAKERWGTTEAYKQSQERLKKMTKADMAKLKEEGDRFMKVVAATMDKGATSPEFQALIDQHYNSLRIWYEPNLTMYRGLANMYVADPRFTAYYEKYAPGLAQVMRDAMIAYCDAREKN